MGTEREETWEEAREVLKFVAGDPPGCVGYIEEMPVGRYVEQVVDNCVSGLDVWKGS